VGLVEIRDSFSHFSQSNIGYFGRTRNEMKVVSWDERVLEHAGKAKMLSLERE
jgi:hypothetical protein